MVTRLPYHKVVCRQAAPLVASCARAVAGCTNSWKAFPGVNVGTCFAGIWTVSPVRELRPVRA
jgi:hypothetical protein